MAMHENNECGPECSQWRTTLVPLMLRDKLPWKIILKPEEKFSVEFADWLRGQSLDGNITCVWAHVPNEGKRSWAVALIVRAMGLLPGVLDYFFLWPRNPYLLELKVKPNGLSNNQKAFRKWCAMCGVPTDVAYTIEEAKEKVLAQEQTYREMRV